MIPDPACLVSVPPQVHLDGSTPCLECRLVSPFYPHPMPTTLHARFTIHFTLTATPPLYLDPYPRLILSSLIPLDPLSPSPLYSTPRSVPTLPTTLQPAR